MPGMPPQSLQGLAGGGQQPAQPSLADMAGGVPPTAQNPGGLGAMFDKLQSKIDMGVQLLQSISEDLRQVGDDPNSAKVMDYMAKLNAIGANRSAQLKQLKDQIQGNMMGVG